MLWYLFSSIAMAVFGLTIYIYYLYRGQFENSEDVKYQMFRDDE